jgi:hypothetical protein
MFEKVLFYFHTQKYTFILRGFWEKFWFSQMVSIYIDSLKPAALKLYTPRRLSHKTCKVRLREL